MTAVELDARDFEILRSRVAAYADRPGPRVGDHVRFADGVERRIAHVWSWGDPDFTDGVQPDAGGRFYLGAAGVSYSGGLDRVVPMDTLAESEGPLRDAPVWFFHHDQHRAHNAVTAPAPFRTFICSLPSPG